MAFNLPPPPTSNDPKDPAFRDWFYKLQRAFSTLGSFLFTNLDFTGSNITSILTRNHADLQNLNTASYTHLTSTQATDLTDGGDSILHYHATDRDLANATGTLAIANGGTGQTTATNAFDALAPTTTAGDIIYHNGTDNVRLAAGTSTQVLHGGATPSWSSVALTTDVTGVLDETNGGTGNSSYTTGDIIYASASSTLSKLPIGTEGQVLEVVSGIPSWEDNAGGQVKIYEPTVVLGFNNNITYIGAEPKVPDFVTTVDGDVVMAWGGAYQ